MFQAVYEALKSGREHSIDRKLVVRSVLSEAFRLDLRRHPLGFIHADLTSEVAAAPGERLRLHVWDGNRAPVDDLGDLHDHVWHLRSWILHGRLSDATYRAVEDDAGPYWGSRVRYGTQNVAQQALRYRLDLVQRREVSANSAYSIPAGIVHKSQPLQIPTVTLVLAVDEAGRREQGPLVLRASSVKGSATPERPKASQAEFGAILSRLLTSPDLR